MQRPHRSNGTFLVADLGAATFSQFCYDAECRAAGFRGSDCLPIPREHCDAVLLRRDQGGAVPGDGLLGGGVQGAAASDWLSEDALAAIPIDDIVAAHYTQQTAQHAAQHAHVHDIGRLSTPYATPSCDTGGCGLSSESLLSACESTHQGACESSDKAACESVRLASQSMDMSMDQAACESRGENAMESARSSVTTSALSRPCWRSASWLLSDEALCTLPLECQGVGASAGVGRGAA